MSTIMEQKLVHSPLNIIIQNKDQGTEWCKRDIKLMLRRLHWFVCALSSCVLSCARAKRIVELSVRPTLFSEGYLWDVYGLGLGDFEIYLI